MLGVMQMAAVKIALLLFLIAFTCVSATQSRTGGKQMPERLSFYVWVGIYAGNGLVVRPVSLRLIDGHLLGEPLSWSELRSAIAPLCERDRLGLLYDFRFNVIYRSLHGSWEERTEGLGERVLGFVYDGFELRQRFWRGGVYSLSVPKDLRVDLPNRPCGGSLLGGPLRYLITVRSQDPSQLKLVVLAGSEWSRNDPIWFTMTEEGPAIFDQHDLDKPRLATLPLFAYSTIPVLLLGGYVILRGYYHGLGIRTRSLPPHGALVGVIHDNLDALASWRTLLFAAIGFTFWVGHAFQAVYVAELWQLWRGPSESGMVRSITVSGIALHWWLLIWMFLLGLGWGLVYLLWACKWLGARETRIYLGGALVIAAYMTLLGVTSSVQNSDEYEQLFQTLMVILGIALPVLFWMYLGGCHAASLLLRRPADYSCGLEFHDAPPTVVTLLAYRKDHLIAFEEGSRMLVIIPTSRVTRMIPGAKSRRIAG